MSERQRERERERASERGREGGRERGRERQSDCVGVRVWPFVGMLTNLLRMALGSGFSIVAWCACFVPVRRVY